MKQILENPEKQPSGFSPNIPYKEKSIVQELEEVINMTGRRPKERNKINLAKSVDGVPSVSDE